MDRLGGDNEEESKHLNAIKKMSLTRQEKEKILREDIRKVLEAESW